MKMDTINAKAASAIKLQNAAGFQELMQGFSKYNPGAVIMLPQVVGQQKWNEMNSGQKVTLGKLVKNNIDSGNLTGLEPLDTPKGMSQQYQITEMVKFKNYFVVPFNHMIEIIEGQIQMEADELYVFTTYDLNGNKVTLKAVIMYLENVIGSYKRDKLIGKCGTEIIRDNNNEFPAIQAVWYGFDRLFENLSELCVGKEIRKIYIIGSNPQMVKRIAGNQFDNEAVNMYHYTEYIQQNFSQFMPGELRGIEIPVELAACHNDDIKKYLKGIQNANI